MASGHGFRGGVSKCYPFWMDFLECMEGVDNPLKCSSQLADYKECIHPLRELRRNTIIHQKKQEYLAKLKPGDKPPGWEMKEKLGLDATALPRKRYPYEAHS